MSISDGKSTAQKCSHTTRGNITKPALLNEVCNFVLAPGDKKLSAKVEMLKVCFTMETTHLKFDA